MIRLIMTFSSQEVYFRDVNSECQSDTCGVPLGSILGPFLFLLYINYMVCVSNEVSMLLFADDTTVLSQVVILTK